MVLIPGDVYKSCKKIEKQSSNYNTLFPTVIQDPIIFLLKGTQSAEGDNFKKCSKWRIT